MHAQPTASVPTDLTQGDALVPAHRHDAAAAAFLDIVRADSSRTDAWLRACDCLWALDRYRDARTCALSALAHGQLDAVTRVPLAQRLRRCEESQPLFALAARVASDASIDDLLDLAALCSSAGEQGLAASLVDRALARAPSDARARYLNGVLAQFVGDTERAERELELCLHLAPGFAQAHWMLAGIAPRHGRDARVPRLQAAIEDASPGSNAESYLQFALHAELHALERYPQAWAALERANGVRRAHVRHDAKAADELFAQIEAICDERFAARCVPAPVDGDAPVPVFIVGMHRSGTTLLERILAGHPRVADGGETQLFAAQLSRATDHAVAGALDGLAIERLVDADDATFAAIGEGFLDASRSRRRERRWFTEKQPANFLSIGCIARALPQARILHLVRDPVDTCFSNLRTYFGRAAPHAFDMLELADCHRGYRRLMHHWHAVLPGRVLDVRYDDLVADAEGVARRVFHFCGLDFDPQALDLSRSGGTAATASHGQVRQGILRNRDGAWRPYATQLSPMIDRLTESE